ncbi:MAG: carbon-nitrogen hydrolase family protein [candidate division Zixibacteria bacterium]|nr:carbon-nitrogen hydrolase family protein [candidate division Zixibacteria bacterium]
MLIKVVAVQSRLGNKLSLEEKLFIFKQRPDFVCLPEYCLIGETTPDFSRAALYSRENLQYMKNLSGEFTTCLIAGSMVEAEGDSLFNSAYLFNRGELMGRYRKLNPMAGEIEKGILPGDKLFTTIIDGVNIAILICADALNSELFTLVGEMDLDIIFIPTTSPYRPGESKSDKYERDKNIYLKNAEISGAYIVKTCGVGQLFNRPLQGRSLIASPWGIIQRVDYHSESSACILAAVLDIEEIREFRQKRNAHARKEKIVS